MRISERTTTVTSPVKSAQRLSKHNQAILTQMQMMTRKIQTLATELEHLPKLGIWNTIQNLSAEVQQTLELDMLPLR